MRLPNEFQIESLRNAFRKLNKWSIKSPGIPVFSRNVVFLRKPGEVVPVSRAHLLNNNLIYLFYGAGVRVSWGPPVELGHQDGIATIPEGGVIIEWARDFLCLNVAATQPDTDPIEMAVAWLEACRPPGHVE